MIHGVINLAHSRNKYLHKLTAKSKWSELEVNGVSIEKLNFAVCYFQACGLELN